MKELESLDREDFLEDDVIREVRRIKQELSARFDHDIEKMFADMRARERDCGVQIVDLSNKSA